MNTDINKAVEILKQGGIVVFPTDTVFGIGCRIDKQDAVEKLFRLRKRPSGQAAPVLISDVKMAEEYVYDIPQDVKEKLIDKFWPGALTIILKCKKEKVPDLVRGGGENIGLRIPNHKTALNIIGNVGFPILGPSANFHGEKAPYEYQDLDKKLLKLVDYVVKGECFIKKASTVVDCTKKPWQVLRKGAIEINI
ncbi:MAG: L-threonylcarbamoyladenylate synthase [Patescibacteria group bacterium]|nr:L-threonylcarbamoyladenylate synthase [Patescibacteria group bacterium]